MPVSNTLGHELPRNVQDLLQAYFAAKNTTMVPTEIYCIQSHRVNTTIDGKRAAYMWHSSGEHVQVRGYSLPSMKHKNSEQLLVAAGRTFPQPIVLARTKPHSNQFRRWFGAADDGTSAPIVPRSIPDHGLRAENKRRASSMSADTAKKRRVAVKKENGAVSHDASEDVVAIEDDDDTITVDSHTYRSPKIARERRATNSRPAWSVDGDEEEQLVGPHSHKARTALSASALSPGSPSVNLKIQHVEQPARYKRRDVSRTSTPYHYVDVSSELLPQTTPTVAEHTIIHFISSITGEETRKRTLGKVENVEALFPHAYAADVLSMNAKGSRSRSYNR